MSEYRINAPNSFNGWDPLEQAILGNSYTPEFFDDVKDSKLRDLLQKLLYETQEDLNNFQRELEAQGVDVVRIPENTCMYNPETNYESISHLYELTRNTEHNTDIWNGWLTSRGGIPRPYISPRDSLITYGNTMEFTLCEPNIIKMMTDNKFIDPAVLNTDLNDARIRTDNAKEYALGPLDPRDEYLKNIGTNIENKHTKFSEDWMKYREMTWFYPAPLVTRVGDRLVVDTAEYSNMGEYISSRYPQYKQTKVGIGGHSDGTFCPVKPGHIITTQWQTDYSDTFPGWNVHVIENSETAGRNINTFLQSRNVTSGKWWTPESENNASYIEYVESWLQDWVGFSEESVFEVNMLVVNPELVFCTNYNKGVFDYLESIGMTPHIVPFRHRWFWDGGLHCLTVDTKRRGGIQSYF